MRHVNVRSGDTDKQNSSRVGIDGNLEKI